MTSPQKFLFDDSFERPDAHQRRSRPRFSESDLAKAREEGFAEGKQAGTREAADSAAERTAQALGTLAKRLPDLAEAQAAAAERQARDAVEAALATVRRLFPRLAQSHGLDEIEAVVSECLERLHEEPRIVIRVADALLDELERRIGALAAQTGFDGRIVLLSQNELAPGDVRVEWADGGAERESEQVWRAIDAVLQRVLGEPRLAPPAEAEDAPATDDLETRARPGGRTALSA